MRNLIKISTYSRDCGVTLKQATAWKIIQWIESNCEREFSCNPLMRTANIRERILQIFKYQCQLRYWTKALMWKCTKNRKRTKHFVDCLDWDLQLLIKRNYWWFFFSEISRYQNDRRWVELWKKRKQIHPLKTQRKIINYTLHIVNHNNETRLYKLIER